MTTPLQMTDPDPWRSIRGVSSAKYYPSKRVSASLNPSGCRIDWSISESGNRLLIVEYNDSDGSSRIPHSKGMRIREDPLRHLLALELTDSSMQDVFLKVCLDIIAVLQNVPSDRQRQICLCRLERWAVFFQTERLGLSPEEQKGLIAELICLEVLLSIFDEYDAVEAWTGPDRTVHDFTLGQDAIEVKSNRGSGTTGITVSSIDQLSVNEKERLFLFVVELNQATDGNGLTLTQYVERVHEQISSPMAEAQFEEKLAHAGYFGLDNYDGSDWSQGISRIFKVSDGFPHLDRTSLNPAIFGVTYRINLALCGKFETTKEELLATLKGA